MWPAAPWASAQARPDFAARARGGPGRPWTGQDLTGRKIPRSEEGERCSGSQEKHVGAPEKTCHRRTPEANAGRSSGKSNLICDAPRLGRHRSPPPGLSSPSQNATGKTSAPSTDASLGSNERPHRCAPAPMGPHSTQHSSACVAWLYIQGKEPSDLGYFSRSDPNPAAAEEVSWTPAKSTSV